MQENQSSWFPNAPYRWAEASFPFAYAFACVEVVTKESEKARPIFKQIVDAWGKPSLTDLFDKIISEVPDSELQKAKDATLNPEIEFRSDFNKPLRDLENLFAEIEIYAENLGEINLEDLPPEKQKSLADAVDLTRLLHDFILFGFNRKSDVEKGSIKVSPNQGMNWLLFAIIIRSSMEYHNVTMDTLQTVYKLREHKGEIIDFHHVLTQEPTSDLHRKMVDAAKFHKLKLKNDGTIYQAAQRWYGSRVAYSGPEEFCRKLYLEQGINLYSSDVINEIEPVDEVTGYPRRKPIRKRKT